ncbi:MAG: ribonuclease T [Pseudomonadota bacterium]
MKRNTLFAALVALALALAGNWLGVDLGPITNAFLSDQQQSPQTSSGIAESAIAHSASSADSDSDADFDFYLLALSWSPTFCADGQRDPQQCGVGKRFGFVTHGLWPQYERGFPADCSTSEPREVSRRIEDAMLDIMPSRGLVRHQWRKHGTCSGLSQRDYFAKVRAATESISIPGQFRNATSPRRLSAREVENAFATTNPKLDANEMAVRCDRRRVKEVRICLTKGLEPRACREVDARGCQQSNLQLLPSK